MSNAINATEVKTIQTNLQELVHKAQSENKLAGFGTVVISNNEVIAKAVSGERELHGGVAISVDDKWHIGSISKSLTATMLGRLVDEGKIAWDDTLNELLSDLSEMHKDWHSVTLHQLLTHTSGLKPNFAPLIILNKPPEGKERTDARLKEVKKILLNAPSTPAGTAFTYSNVGFTIAGVIAEQKTGKTWENLIREYVYEPLNITSGGFGPPQDKGDTVEQPRGHRKGFFGGKKSVGTDFDNTPIMGPAGIIHMSLQDLAKYTNDHMQGEKGNGILLKTETYKRIHTAELESYAYGWVVFDKREWASGPVIWHNGSNTVWYALTVFMPELDTVISITSNDGDIQTAETAAFDIVKKIALQIKNENEDD